MATIVKYELKKIFQSKLFVGIFVIALAGMLVSSANSLNAYRVGSAGKYALSDMQGVKLPEIFVSNDNIDSFRAALKEYESRDEIYESAEEHRAKHPEGGAVYRGNRGVDDNALLLRLRKGEITESEMYEIMNEGSEDRVIKDEYLPEYFKLLYPVEAYHEYVSSIDWMRHDTQEYRSGEYYKQLNILLADELESALEEGVTVGYDYGWGNIFASLSGMTGILLAAVIIFGLCNVFSGEYASGADALLLSSKRGRRRLVSAKVIASVVYCAVCCLTYIAMTAAVSFIFLGADGAGVGKTESNLERLLSLIPCVFLGCVLVGLLTLAVSAIFSKQITSIAVSSLVGPLPCGAAIAVTRENILGALIEALPVNIIFGSYIYTDGYAFFNGQLFDLRWLFIPVAAVVLAVCLPTIYLCYCRHQVKN